MTLDHDLGIKSYKGVFEEVPLEPLEPLAETAERVDACKGAILSESQAGTGVVFFVGIIVGALGGTTFSEMDVPQKIHSLAPVWFALAAFFVAVSLSVYRISLVQGCCSRRIEVL